MTTLRLSLVVASLFALQGCAVDVSRDLPEQRIAGNVLAQGLSRSVQFSSEQQAADPSLAGNITLAGVVLNITSTAEPSGDSDCFDFVNSASVYLESLRPDSQLPRIPIATASAPGCVRNLYLDPAVTVNLRPYVSEGFRVITEAYGSVPADDVSFNGTVYLRVGL